jgi:hypothetical protein
MTIYFYKYLFIVLKYNLLKPSHDGPMCINNQQKEDEMKWKMMIGIVVLTVLAAFSPGYAAYDHGGADTDSDVFLTVYPETAGTKLDSCVLCHSSGQYEKKPGVWVTLGSCQWCHQTYGYDESGDINETLNPYGQDYRDYGRDAEALAAIADLDSDGDTFSNAAEIAALRFPGNADDDPAKVPAPYRIFTREKLESQPQHNQFMLMNTNKSGDFYATYEGVPMADLLEQCGILPTATGLMVFAADGWAQYHPLEEDLDPLHYPVYGNYPGAVFYYNEIADGWCDYSAPECANYAHGDSIEVENGLQLLLAIKRNGDYLEPGVLTDDNKLDGEGPFRVVPPQKVPGPPDQPSNASDNTKIWPFDENADHNAGFASRSATMIRVDPLPEGTTDIDTLEAGWNYVDQGKIIVYGAIDPLPTIDDKLQSLMEQLWTADAGCYKNPVLKWITMVNVAVLKHMIHKGAEAGTLKKINNDLLRKVDGCQDNSGPDKSDWITDCELQSNVYWSLHEISVLTNILAQQ